MELLVFWLGLALIVGVAANNKGRSGFGWFLLAILVSPLLAGLLILVMSPQSRVTGTNRPTPPFTAEEARRR